MSKGISNSIASMVLLLLGTSTSQADFCEDLFEIVDSASDGFAAVRGELVSDHQGELGDTRVLWECKLALPGARTCEVEWLRQAYNYNTFWHKQSEEANAEAFAAVSELVVGCGLTKKQASQSGRSILYVVEGVENLDIVLARNARRVRLSFTTSGFSNP